MIRSISCCFFFSHKTDICSKILTFSQGRRFFLPALMWGSITHPRGRVSRASRSNCCSMLGAHWDLPGPGRCRVCLPGTPDTGCLPIGLIILPSLEMPGIPCRPLPPPQKTLHYYSCIFAKMLIWGANSPKAQKPRRVDAV